MPRVSNFLSFAVNLSSLCNWKGAQSYKKPVSLRGDTGLKWDNTDLIALVFLWFPIPLVFYSPYKANGGTDMEVLGLFRPCFFCKHRWIDRFKWLIIWGMCRHRFWLCRGYCSCGEMVEFESFRNQSRDYFFGGRDKVLRQWVHYVFDFESSREATNFPLQFTRLKMNLQW